MEEQMSKRFIRVAAVLLLLLLVAEAAGRELKRGTADKYGAIDHVANTGIPEEAGQEAEIPLHEEITGDGCFSDIPQCIWGKWVVTEKWRNANCGWDANVEDEWIGTSIELRPDSFGLVGQSDKRMYYAHVMAVEDPWKWYEETGIYWELGIRGDYYFVFSFGSGNAQNMGIHYWMLGSENEIVIPVTRYAAYKLEKTENYDVEEEDGSFEVDGISYDICYGEWEATDIIRTNGTVDLAVCMKERLVLRENKDMDLTWRVLGRSNETVNRFARMVGVGENNGYLICYNLPEDCFWEQMILIDDMTVVLTKGDNLFLARRISDPVEDCIYRTLP